MFVPCTIPDCAGNAHHSAKGSRGYCSKHAYRLRKHGDPLGGRTSPGAPMRFYNETVLSFDGDECLFWPFARNSAGYGHMLVNGQNQLIHRLVCEHSHGPAPAGAWAAHSCGNGHLGCCNQRHLRWAQPVENSNDTLLHGRRVQGERQHMAKLTPDIVRSIRSSTETVDALAERYGCTKSNIRYVQSGRTWRHVA